MMKAKDIELKNQIPNVNDSRIPGTYAVYGKVQRVLDTAIDKPETWNNALKYALHAMKYCELRWNRGETGWFWVSDDIQGLIKNFRTKTQLDTIRDDL